MGAVSPTLGAVSFSECFLVLHVFGIAAAFCMQQDLHFGFYGDLDKSQPSRRRLEKIALSICNMCIFLYMVGLATLLQQGNVGGGQKKRKYP